MRNCIRLPVRQRDCGLGHGGLAHLCQGLDVRHPLVVDEIVLLLGVCQELLGLAHPVLALDEVAVAAALQAGGEQGLGVLKPVNNKLPRLQDIFFKKQLFLDSTL